MITKICKFCGKSFETAHGNVKFCSDECRKLQRAEEDHQRYISRKTNPVVKHSEKHNIWTDTLCWSCSKACGECSWSRSLTPVEGWEAEEVSRSTNHNEFPSYKVLECPEYIEGR